MRTLLSIAFIICASIASAQNYSIDSLHSVLSSLKDTARVDCLNHLAWSYTSINKDSVRKYSDQAFNEANTLRYALGKGRALHAYANILTFQLGDFSIGEDYFHQAKIEYELANDQLGVVLANLGIGSCERAKCVDDSALIYFTNARKLAEKAGFANALSGALLSIGGLHALRGEYWLAFEHSSRALKIASDAGDSMFILQNLRLLGTLHTFAGDYQAALGYYTKAVKFTVGATSLAHPYTQIGNVYLELKKYDSALYYSKEAIRIIHSITLDSEIRHSSEYGPMANISRINLVRGKYDEALDVFSNALEEHRKYNRVSLILEALCDLSTIYQKSNRHDSALSYARALVQLSKRTGRRPYMRDGSLLLYSIFDQSGTTDSALFYFRQYHSLKDSMDLDQFRVQLALNKVLTENKTNIALLHADRAVKVRELAAREKELQKGSWEKKMLASGLIAVILLAIVVYRNIMLKRKNETLKLEQRQAQLQQQATYQERMRISAELHDDLGGELSAIRLLSEMHSENADSQLVLSKISSSSAELVQKMNEIVWALNVNNDSLQSLAAYIRRYSVKYLDDVGISCTFNYQFSVPDRAVDGATRRNVFLLVKESLHNVVKHSGATSVIIDINFNEQLCITVKDNGRGISEENVRDAPGNGFRNMQLRTEDMKGVMEVENHNGTSVIFQIPLDSNNAKG